MKYIAGILIGASITGLVWTNATRGPNGWAMGLIVGLAFAIAAEIAAHNKHPV